MSNGTTGATGATGTAAGATGATGATATAAEAAPKMVPAGGGGSIDNPATSWVPAPSDPAPQKADEPKK